MLLWIHSAPGRLLRHEWPPLNLLGAALAFCLGPLLGAGPGPEICSSWGLTPAGLNTFTAACPQGPAVAQASGPGTGTLSPHPGSTCWFSPLAGSGPAPSLLWFPQARQRLSGWQGLAQNRLSFQPGGVSGRDGGRCQQAAVLPLGGADQPACPAHGPHSQHGQQRLRRPAGLGGPAGGMEFLACQQGGRVPVFRLGSLFRFRVKVMMACEQCGVPEVSGPKRRQLSLKMPFSRLRTLSLGCMGVSLT